MRRSAPAALAILVLLAGWGARTAAAQEAIATGKGAPMGGAPTMTWPAGDDDEDTLRLSDHVDGGPGFLRPRGPCGGPLTKPDGTPDKSPHGQVWAGVGTNGYREIGGVACVPLGQTGSATIAIDAGQMNGWGWGGWNGRRR